MGDDLPDRPNFSAAEDGLLVRSDLHDVAVDAKTGVSIGLVVVGSPPFVAGTWLALTSGSVTPTSPSFMLLLVGGTLILAGLISKSRRRPEASV